MSSSAVEDHSKSTPTDSKATGGPRHVWYLVAVVLFVVGVYVGVGFWEDPPMGQSLINLIQYAVIAITPGLIAIWLIFLSGFGKRGILAGCLLVLLSVGGSAAVVRDVEFDGNMKMTFHYRWEPLEANRIEEHRAKQGEQAPVQGTADEEARKIFHESFSLAAEDMPEFRGKNREGIIAGPVLSTDWEKTPPKQLWRIPVGEGYASMAIAGKRLVTMEQRGESEAITCYEADSGRELWKHEYPGRFYESMGGLGPRSTPTIDERGYVYTQGALGMVCCLDLLDGKLVWQHQILEENGLPNVTWALSSSPLIIGEMVIVNAGGPSGRGLIAYDRNDGKLLWKGEGLGESAGENRAGYSSPRLATLAGVEQILFIDGEGLGGYDILTGKTLWFYPFENGAGVNVAQPIVLPEDRVLISASYDIGSALLKVTRDGQTWKTETVWAKNNSLKSKFTSPVLHDGFVYGLHDAATGVLTCLDPVENKFRWRGGRYGHGQVLLTGELIFVLTEQGEMVLVKASPEKFEELSRLSVLSDTAKVWNPPALVGNRAYVRDHREMACYELPVGP